MEKYIRDFTAKIGFPADATSFFAELYNSLDDETVKKLEYWRDVFMWHRDFEDKSIDKTEIWDVAEKGVAELADKSGVNVMSMGMLFFIMCAKLLEGDYRQKGLDDSLYLEIMKDLTYKLEETKKLHDVWGSHTFSWYHRIFTMRTFALGRFQYTNGIFKGEDMKFGSFTLHKGDRVCDFHIPSSGPMTAEMRMASYKKAYEFFKKPDEKYVVLACGSWLLYPGNREVFAEGSNLLSFMDDFESVSFEEASEENRFRDAWRVFYKDFDGNTSALPRETSLQRRYIEWLDADKSHGVGRGYGVIVFDGEKIVRSNKE